MEKKGFKLPERAFPVGLALLVGGVLFLLVEFLIRGKYLGNEITWAVAIAVGLGQLVAAVFPGLPVPAPPSFLRCFWVSSRPAATEFTFLVGIPTMLAAGGLKIFKAFTIMDCPTP